MDEQRRHVVQMLSEAVDAWSASVGSGRLGFDYAVNTHQGYNDNASDLYQLRRIGLPVTTSRALIGRELMLGFLRPGAPLQASR